MYTIEISNNFGQWYMDRQESTVRESKMPTTAQRLLREYISLIVGKE